VAEPRRASEKRSAIVKSNFEFKARFQRGEGPARSSRLTKKYFERATLAAASRVTDISKPRPSRPARPRAASQTASRRNRTGRAMRRSWRRVW
jgi:hypothetical protein